MIYARTFHSIEIKWKKNLNFLEMQKLRVLPAVLRDVPEFKLVSLDLWKMARFPVFTKINET